MQFFVFKNYLGRYNWDIVNLNSTPACNKQFYLIRWQKQIFTDSEELIPIYCQLLP